mmetsp:Transcript_50654/g.131693  ORF Transcript_50654/g.131693 Transcript_50654/m.131693 type:complete len:208 (+) Transcript_50654:1085-1708(+)
MGPLQALRRSGGPRERVLPSRVQPGLRDDCAVVRRPPAADIRLLPGFPDHGLRATSGSHEVAPVSELGDTGPGVHMPGLHRLRAPPVPGHGHHRAARGAASGAGGEAAVRGGEAREARRLLRRGAAARRRVDAPDCHSPGASQAPPGEAPGRTAGRPRFSHGGHEREGRHAREQHPRPRSLGEQAVDQLREEETVRFADGGPVRGPW